MTHPASSVTLTCDDGVILHGHLWPAQSPIGQVIINPATGVLARYYHRYARFLADHGYDVLTYDYRGIGASRPSTLRFCRYRWYDWGLHDFEAALNFMTSQRGPGPLAVIGHSFGGLIPGLAASAAAIDRILTMGAQFGWLGDYAPKHRLSLIAKFHIAMPLATAICGYFPGRRLGWLEDLPANVANQWSFHGPRLPGLHAARMARVTAPITAVVVADDELATESAVLRALRYYTASHRIIVRRRPEDYGLNKIGHFHLFHSTHAAGFWTETLQWLQTGANPWPETVIAELPQA